MIGDILNYIRVEIRDHIRLRDEGISLGHLHADSIRGGRYGVRLALVNLTEEAVVRLSPQDLRRGAFAPGNANPPAPFSLYIAIAFDLDDYQASLNLLSKTRDLFQAQPVFDAGAQRPANPFPASLQRLQFDVQNYSLAELDHLWSVNGGALLPSLFYRVQATRANVP